MQLMNQIMNNMSAFKKIPLGPFLEILTELYEDGVDYIDISGEVSKDALFPQDVIKITVKPEYINTDDIEDQSTIFLDKDNINDLI